MPDLAAGLVRLGYAAFRPGQREAVETLLANGRLLLVAPTGGGKSLIYQLPASLLPGTSLVVSPLVALMNDQVRALEARGVPATYLAATLEPAEMRLRMARLAAGAYKLAYVAPERLAFPGFRAVLHRLQVPLLAIDEAHCISEWGHDFRPEYMAIGDLVEQLQPSLVLACTATATPVVRDEILARLGLGPGTPQLVRGFARPNLALRAVEVGSEAERHAHVDALLQEALAKPDAGRGAAIIYVMTRRSADAEGARLCAAGWRAGTYHAGLDGPSRQRVQSAFIERRLEVIVATNAFGMGIDRPDVRAVVHLGPPGSIEAYYQEVGRAGRDGADAWGLLLVSPSDMPLRRRLLEKGGDGGPTPPAVVEHKWGMFLELLRWAEGGSCRHDAILRYFDDEAETLHGCGRCDVCCSLAGEPGADRQETTLVVRKALSAVARVHRRFGIGAAVKLLRGAPDPRLERAGLHQTPTYGALRERSEDWLLMVLRRCVTAGFVDLTPGERPVVLLTEAGRAVMKAERPVHLVLPSTPAKAASGPRPTAHGRRPDSDALGAQAAALFEALRQQRLLIARAEGVPPFVVAADRTLREIAQARPRTLAELKLVHGIGEVKAARYGQRFLEVVERAP
jgi:ATP-dependent DNA helicase RecQ